MNPVRYVRRMLGVAKRAITSLPWSHGGDSLSAVNSSAALSLIPYFACVRLLSEQISSLPLSVLSRRVMCISAMR